MKLLSSQVCVDLISPLCENATPVALRIQKRSWKNADGSVSESWRLIVEDYRSGSREDLYPKKSHYPRYGFDSEDTYEQAKEKLKSIQARNKITRTAERQAKSNYRKATLDLKDEAYLPAWLYQNFLIWLKQRRMWDAIPIKTESHLRCMRAIVNYLGTDPSTWPDNPELIFRFFISKKLSLSYIDKVLPLLNEYGYYYCRELKKPFIPIKAPSPDIARKIDDVNHSHRDGLQQESKPIFPEMLSKLASWPNDKLLWMRFSKFFGLRPSEVDELIPKNEGRIWEITKDPRGVFVLHFYQRKLVKISRERRWKRIPCILKEQQELLEDLRAGSPLSRPLVKTLQAYLGGGYGLYGGRKGFERLMRDQGQNFINISRWLGHQDILRTERNYRDSEAVEYDPTPDPETYTGQVQRPRKKPARPS